MKLATSFSKWIPAGVFFAVMSSALLVEGQEFRKPVVFPVPREMQLTGEEFPLTEETVIIVPVNASENDMFLARSLSGELSSKYSISVKTERAAALPENKKVILMGAAGNPLVKKYCQSGKLELTSRNPGPEGYLLHVDAGLVVVAGWDDAGAFYGLQSLRQLIRNGNGNSVAGIRVRDWPQMPFTNSRNTCSIPGQIPPRALMAR